MYRSLGTLFFLFQVNLDSFLKIKCGTGSIFLFWLLFITFQVFSSLFYHFNLIHLILNKLMLVSLTILFQKSLNLLQICRKRLKFCHYSKTRWYYFQCSHFILASLEKILVLDKKTAWVERIKSDFESIRTTLK